MTGPESVGGRARGGGTGALQSIGWLAEASGEGGWAADAGGSWAAEGVGEGVSRANTGTDAANDATTASVRITNLHMGENPVGPGPTLRSAHGAQRNTLLYRIYREIARSSRFRRPPGCRSTRLVLFPLTSRRVRPAGGRRRALQRVGRPTG